MSTKVSVPKKLYHKQPGETKVVLLSKDDWFRRIRQEHDASKQEAESFPVYLEIAASDGGFEPDIPEDWSKEDRQRALNLFKAVQKAYKAHLDYEQDIKDEEEEAKKEEAKRGSTMMVAAAKGRAQAEIVVRQMDDDINKVFKKFKIEGMSLEIAKGAKPTEEDFSNVIAGLAGIDEKMGAARCKLGFLIGDACLLAEASGLDMDEVVTNAARVRGQSKFTIMQAIKTAREFKPEERIEGFTMTHHQELVNYGATQGKIAPAKLAKIIEECRNGEKEEIETPDGRKVEVVNPKSVKDLRGALQEATGKTDTQSGKGKKGAKGGAAGTSDANFVYITVDKDGNEEILIHCDLSMKACEDPSVTVLDLQTMTQLDRKGQAAYPLKALPDSWFPKVEAPKPTPKKEEKKPEPKKEAKAPEKKASNEIPD